MNRTPQFIYTAETVFVVFPSTLFLVATFFWVPAAFSLKTWLTLSPPFLWLGGALGVIALWQMRERLWQINAICIPSQKSKIKLLRVKLLAGMISAIAPILFIYSGPDNGKRAYVLLFLLPIAVGVHWAWTLKAEDDDSRN